MVGKIPNASILLCFLEIRKSKYEGPIYSRNLKCITLLNHQYNPAKYL